MVVGGILSAPDCSAGFGKTGRVQLRTLPEAGSQAEGHREVVNCVD
jgi:hypothetical protein